MSQTVNICISKYILWRKAMLTAPRFFLLTLSIHYGDIIMGAIASQITSLTIVYSTVYSDTDQRKHQSSASLAFVWAIHRGPVNSPHKWPVTRKMFPFDDVIMKVQRKVCSLNEWCRFSKEQAPSCDLMQALKQCVDKKWHFYIARESSVITKMLCKTMDTHWI